MQHLLGGNGNAMLGHSVNLMPSKIVKTEELDTSEVVVKNAVPPPNLILDENVLPFVVNEAFLQQQRMLYQQLTGSFRNDASTIQQQEEALAKISLKNNNVESTETKKVDEKPSDASKDLPSEAMEDIHH
uniref:Uncharacterized protein n=1 Tax=Panagrolaimus superbus TaxID=310955 RepID=A0A914XTT0_9BILA